MSTNWSDEVSSPEVWKNCYDAAIAVAVEKEKKIVSLESLLEEQHREVVLLRNANANLLEVLGVSRHRASNAERRLSETRDSLKREREVTKRLKTERDAAVADVFFTKNMLAVVTGEAIELDHQVADLLSVK